MFLAILVVISLAVVAVKYIVFPGRAFDAVLWNDDVQIKAGIRLAMADRLLADKALLGLTGAEVITLLGEPENRQDAGSDLIYWLGPERRFISIDSELLDVRLGPNGRVTDALIVTD